MLQPLLRFDIVDMMPEQFSHNTLMLGTLMLDGGNAAMVLDWQIGDAPLSVAHTGIAAAIGNFDGIHLGHRGLIKAAFDGGAAVGLIPAIITFSPHPRKFFQHSNAGHPNVEQEDTGFALADSQDKLAYLAALGAKIIIRINFNDSLCKMTAEDFIDNVLPALGVKQLYAGVDFAFGNDRRGNMAMIDERGASRGITAHAVDLSQDETVVISSSRIRGFIAKGDMESAAALLGRPYVISGTVIKGDQRGRTIGFPTANIQLGEMTHPAFGVYAITARIAGQSTIYNGVANIGTRPTANNRGVLLEANLFDYDNDLYGQRLNIFMLKYIRPEQAFDNFDKLKQQIASDAEIARGYHQPRQVL